MPINMQTTVGSELEFFRLGTNATDGLKPWLRFHLHNDGSVRDHTYLAGTLPVIPQETERGAPILSAGMKQQQPYGLEIITEPYTFEEFRPISQKLAYFFSTTPQNPRTSIHVHVDANNESWKDVQHLCIWFKALEAIIYRVACGGALHRGCRSYQGSPNDHKFARPLSAPIGVQWGSKVGPLVRWPDLVAATSASEFVAAWGRLDQYWSSGLEHYMPHRLHGLNIASILRTGTIEWRVFDGLYQYFDILVDFVYHVHQLAAKRQLPDFDFVLGSAPKVDVDWVNNLLDMDVSQLWGENWQKGCAQQNLLSHYPSQPVLNLPSTGVMTISNRDQRDDRSEAFKLLIRGG